MDKSLQVQCIDVSLWSSDNIQANTLAFELILARMSDLLCSDVGECRHLPTCECDRWFSVSSVLQSMPTPLS